MPKNNMLERTDKKRANLSLWHRCCHVEKVLG